MSRKKKNLKPKVKPQRSKRPRKPRQPPQPATAMGSGGSSSSSSSSSGSSGGGSMMKLRGGIKGLVGSGKDSGKPKSTLSKIGDVVFWVALVGAIAFFLYSRFNK